MTSFTNHPPRRPLIEFLALIVCVSAILKTANGGPSSSQDPVRPNIVFILADDLGYGEVGYHAGYRRGVYTPNIDRLAINGVRLENYYVEPICTPTRAQFLSGRSQIHTGLQRKNILPRQPNGLPLDSPTMADKMREAGYSTHMVGKWHLGFYKKDYIPTSRGFDSFYGMYLGSGSHYTHSHCGRCSIDLHDDTPTKQQGVASKRGVYSTHLYTQKAVDSIYAHNTQKPLFLFLSYQAVHGPLQVPQKYIKVLKRRFRRKRYRGKQIKLRKAAMTLAMDYGVGKVQKALKRSGLWNNTVLIFSTDNGAPRKLSGVNLPLRGYKGSFFQGGIRGVGFVNSPLLQHRGYTNHELMHVTDWFPTFTRLANVTLKGTHNVTGFDQWDVISKRAATERREIIHNIDTKLRNNFPRFKNHTFDTRWRAALRVGDYKLFTGDAVAPGYHLFNLRKDPYEHHDLALIKPAKVREMLDRLQHHQDTAVPVRYPRSERVKMGKFWGPWK